MHGTHDSSCSCLEAADVACCCGGAVRKRSTFRTGAENTLGARADATPIHSANRQTTTMMRLEREREREGEGEKNHTAT